MDAGWKPNLEAWQQRQGWVGFPLAVLRKSSEDRATKLAVIVAYYALFGIFPLLLALVTILDTVLADNPELRQDILESALGQFPVVGEQLIQNPDGIPGSGVALIVGVVGALLGARGMANAFRYASDTVWAVPFERRPRFVNGQLRALALIVVVPVGLVATTTVTGAYTQYFDLPLAATIAGAFGIALFDTLVFLLAFRLSTAATVPTRPLWFAALLAGCGWSALQLLGSWLVAHQVSRSSALYGTFALVIGLIVWLYLSAYVTTLAIEVAAVWNRGLWPRAFLAMDQLTAADRRALTALAGAERRNQRQRVLVTFDPPPAPDDDRG